MTVAKRVFFINFLIVGCLLFNFSLRAQTVVTDSNLIYSAWVASHEYIVDQWPDSQFICWSSFSEFSDYTVNHPAGRAGFVLTQNDNGNYVAKGYALKNSSNDGYFAYWCEMQYDFGWAFVNLSGVLAGSWFTGNKDICDCNPDRGYVSDTSSIIIVPGWYISEQAALICSEAGDTIVINNCPGYVFDFDDDGVSDACDNCPIDFNPSQADADSNGVGDACCCIGTRGDLNGDGDDANILDLTCLVDIIFRIVGSGCPGGCPVESDVNGDGNAGNILDLTYLVDVIFRGGPVPPACP